MNTKPRIGRKLADAIEALLTGEAKTQVEAAAIAGMNRSQLCRALKKPHVLSYIDQQIDKSFGGPGKLAAASRMLRLVDAGSEQIAFNAADRVLRIAGVDSKSERALVGAGIALQIVFKHHAPSGNGQPEVVIEASAGDCKTPLLIDADKSGG